MALVSPTVNVPEGYHDGGLGECLLLGNCASGYHDAGDGSCVPLGECAEGYHDGGDGSYVTRWFLCQNHDGGDAICVLEDRCSIGYHDNGIGICVASGCADGFHNGGYGACGCGYLLRRLSQRWFGCARSMGRAYGGLSQRWHRVMCCCRLCLTDYHDAGTGRCLLNGVCESGYHNGGDGTCVTMDTCSPGYKKTVAQIFAYSWVHLVRWVTMTAATVFVYRQGNVAWDIKTGVTGRAKSKVCVH